MEEQPSWRSHGFTLAIFGGIVTLSAIFFVLGMLVGRTQGRQIAEEAAAEKAANTPASVASAGDFKLNLYEETAGDKADLKLEPPPQAAKQAGPSISAPPGDSKSSKKAVASAVVAKPKAPEAFLQVYASKDEKKALEELKRVRSKGFKAKIVNVVADNTKWHRVVVGPYKEAEIKLAQSDLHAKGYKDAIIR